MGTDKTLKIYCAGPLFNDKEKEEMAEIAAVLEDNGFRVFLPHRDGFEFANLSDILKNMGLSADQANRLLNKAIFDLCMLRNLSYDSNTFI